MDAKVVTQQEMQASPNSPEAAMANLLECLRSGELSEALLM